VKTTPLVPVATLPYTGLSLLWAIVAGGTLLLVGAAILRIARELRDSDQD
jgi:LPXTG-motif cell wall-anchored protein